MKVTVEEGERETKQTRKGFDVETQIYISLCSEEEAIQTVREQ